MPPLLAGEIEETTGLYDALSRVRDVEISCGVLRIACDDFIGLIGIQSSNRIVGAVTKDPNAGRLTDSGAVEKILGLTAGSFEYYEVPQKELSRLNQNLEMDITDLLTSHLSGNGDLTEVTGEDGAGSELADVSEADHHLVSSDAEIEAEPESSEQEHLSATEAEAESLQVVESSEEVLDDALEASDELSEADYTPADLEAIGAESVSQSELDAVGANYSKGELDSIGTPNHSKSELDSIGTPNYSKSELDSIGTSNYSKSELDSIGTSNYSKGELDSIGTPQFSKNELDAIGTATPGAEGAETPKPAASKPGNLLAKFKKDSKTAAGAPESGSGPGTPPADASAGPNGQTDAPFDPSTDAVTLNAQANVERLKKFRPPDSEIEAEAARAQRMKFASKKSEPLSPASEAASEGATEADPARVKNIRRSGPQQVPDATRTARPAFKISPKVGIAVGAVAGLAALFFVVRIPVSQALMSSAESQFNKRDFKGAESTINPIFFFDPSNAQAHFLKGRILAAQNKMGPAFDEYDQALPANPMDGDLLRAHALAAWKLNKNSILKKDTDTLIANDPTAKSDGFLYGLRAKAELDLGDSKSAADDCTTAIRMGQKTPWLYARRGWALVNQGNAKAALKDFNTALSFPKNISTADAYVGKAAALRALKDNDGAMAAYNAALKIDDKSPSIYATRAWLYCSMNQFDKALADYNTALRCDPGYTAASISIADIYTRQNKPEEALKVLLAIPKKYDGFDLFIAKARAYLRVNKMKEALANFQKGLALDPKRDPNAYMDEAYCYGSVKNFNAALAAVQAAIDIAPKNAQYVAQHGYYNQCLGNTVTAAQEFEKALSLDPKNADAHFWRGGLFEQKGDTSSAIQDYEAALAGNPNNIDAKKRLAALSKVQRHSSVAVASVADTIKIIPGDYETLMSQGYAKMKAHDGKAACNYFASAVKVNPNSTQARKYLAYALIMKGNSMDAISELQSLAASGAADSTDQRNLGILLLDAKRASEAVDVFLKLVTENPRDTFCRLKLIEAYANSGDLTKAVESCQDGQKVDPGATPQYLATLEKLKTKSTLTTGKARISMPEG
ncbi:MAG TPA: tetratricopeptide repeat protein [Drouetiella sp.]